MTWSTLKPLVEVVCPVDIWPEGQGSWFVLGDEGEAGVQREERMS